VRTAFAELRAAKVAIAVACALTGGSRATHYRRAQVLALLNSGLYRDLAIPQVWGGSSTRAAIGVRSRACTGLPATPGRAGNGEPRPVIRPGFVPSWSHTAPARCEAGTSPR
jgi:hypothetical protein